MLVPDGVIGDLLTWASLFCAVTSIRYGIVDSFQKDAERYSFSRGFLSTIRLLTLVARVGANSFYSTLLRRSRT